MKKSISTLSVLSMLLIALCFCDCADNSEKCFVNISSEVYKGFLGLAAKPEITSITIKNKRGRTVGDGSEFGGYDVPKDGSITICWLYRCNKTVGEAEYTIDVHSSKELDVVIYNSCAESSIIIGGEEIKSFYYDE